MKVKVIVMPKQSILDPQGVAVRDAMRHHGLPGVKFARVGKVIDLQVEGDGERTALLGRQIGVLDLSVRTENALRAANIKLIADLVVMDETEVSGIRNLGKIAAKELKKKLADRGLSFGMRLTTKSEA